MKEYSVSLACQIPINANVQVKANSQEEAEKLAIEMFEDGRYELDEEPLWGEELLDVGEPDKDGRFPGVDITEW